MDRKLRIGSMAVLAGAAFLAVSGLASRANAALIYTTPTTLDNLSGTGATFDVGDLTFSNFSYNTTSPTMPAASGITVTPETLIVNGQTTVGLEFSGAFAGISLADAIIQYQVATDSGNAEIQGAALAGNPSVIGTSGAMTVTETWTPENATQEATIYSIKPGSNQLVDSVQFTSPVSNLNVTKDIEGGIFGSGGIATISRIDQTYFETPGGGSGIPEPASLGLLGLGAMGLIARRRR